MGRPDEQLYRGARLAQALDWRATREPQPDAGRAGLHSEHQRRARTIRHGNDATETAPARARANRRLRALLAGTGVLLAIALHRSRSVWPCDSAIRPTAPPSWPTPAVSVPRRWWLTTSIMHCCWRWKMCSSTRFGGHRDPMFIAALARNLGLVASTHGAGPGSISTALSPDGAVAALRSKPGAVCSLYSTGTRELLGTYNAVTAWRTTYRARRHASWQSAPRRV